MNILNKEKRSIILSLLLGDGNLYNGKVYNSTTGYITLKHSNDQEDWLLYKKQFLEKAVGKILTLHDKTSYVKATNRSYPQKSITVGMRRFRSWYKMFYPNRKKDLSLMLKFINDPIFAASIWMGDDGSVNNAYFRKKQPELGLIATGLIIYTCDQTEEQCKYFVRWFEKNLNVSPKVKFHKAKHKNEIKIYPVIRFNFQESMKLWKQIRDILLQIPSMQHKFRRIEERYKKWSEQPPGQNINSDKT